MTTPSRETSMHFNPVLFTDSYKASHWKLYPPEVDGVYGYLTARGGIYPKATLFGLQHLLDSYLSGVRISHGDVDEAKAFWAEHFGRTDVFNEAGFRRIVDVHEGRWPVTIRAIPEGLIIPARLPLLTVRNTDPELPWVTTYLETLIDQLWYPSTIAMQSAAIRQMVLDNLHRSGTPELIDSRVHDFGFRGSTSVGAAALGGAAHLLSFAGTDNVAGLLLARDCYAGGMAGFSVPAAEHSTVTAWGRDNEAKAFGAALDAYPTGFLSVVSDSYDIMEACRIWGGALKEQVLARDGVLVVRPDSGDPAETVLKVLHALGDGFGHDLNVKGYKIINPCVRVIQGDGIDHAAIAVILSRMATAGWSADNVVFGSGGGLLQKVTRDTLGYTFKASAVRSDGIWRSVYKEPIGDRSKASLGGIIETVYAEDGEDPCLGLLATPNETFPEVQNLMRTVYADGARNSVREDFSDIRARVRAPW